MVNKKILVVDDEESIRWVIGRHMEKAGYSIEYASSGNEALKKGTDRSLSLIILDLKLPDMGGLEVFEELRTAEVQTPVIIITAQNTMKNAIEAMKLGAYDYIAKPFDLDEIAITSQRAISSYENSKKLKILRGELNESAGFELTQDLIGSSPEMLKIYKSIGRIAENEYSVLISGESGTGKELVTRAIHYNSKRKNHKLVSVNITAIPRDLIESELFGYEKGAFTGATTRKQGRFEEAHLGTLHLDEIGEMPIDLQAKLLRVLEEKSFYRLGAENPIEVDIRLIASTNKYLPKEVDECRLRKDLYYRLSTISIYIPPLRERREDIPVLIEHFIAKYIQELGEEERTVSNEAKQLMFDYDWPGNVRELENTLKRVLVLTSDSIITKDILLEAAPYLGMTTQNQPQSLDELLNQVLPGVMESVESDSEHGIFEIIMKQVEKPLIETALRMTSGNKKKAASVLGINRNTLSKKIDELGIGDLNSARSASKGD
ncbi:MAG: sigma-54-dependent Fis family transcriptional regulator [Candidatus Dadabacteria bacterium]|nr:sigma-54-dependent Fis family transcriptional regulator [Candidatus Dadabacteria bacterium]